MTAAEKTDLFSFLTAAEDWISGYRADHPVPQFIDSPEEPEVAEKMHFSSIVELGRAVLSCDRCPLGAGRLMAVPGEGPAESARIPVMVIGPAPGEADEKAGRPFSGEAGALLDRMLGAIKLVRTENCFLTGLVKCRPPLDRKPEAGEVFLCSSWLDAQTELLRPALILALGPDTARSLLGTHDDIESLRGKFYDYRGIPLLVSHHPEEILADENLKRPAWEDLKLFRSELDRIWHDGSK